jgi:hypothetical protein
MEADMNEDAAQIEAQARREAADMEARILHDPNLQQEWLQQDNLIYGGLIAGCVALLQPFLTAASLDLPATVAVVSFAVAIPLLAGLLMVNRQETFRHRRTGLRVVSITKVAGQGLAVLGVAAAFWHILWVAGVALLASGLVAVFVHSAGFNRLELGGPRNGRRST